MCGTVLINISTFKKKHRPTPRATKFPQDIIAENCIKFLLRGIAELTKRLQAMMMLIG